MDEDEYMDKHKYVEMQEPFENSLFLCLFVYHYNSSIDEDSCFYKWLNVNVLRAKISFHSVVLLQITTMVLRFLNSLR